jgi:DNA-directed RNA polymerase subunit E'/Rpb7
MAESSLWMRSTELSLHVSPRFLGAARRAIDLHLASLIMKFHPTLNGVPVACPKYKVLSHAAIINTDFPLMHFNVKADFIVFAPKVGAQLSGKINQVSCDHVGLLVHGCFNASIPSAQLKPSYYFDENDSVWCDDKGRQVLVTEALIVFTVTGIEHVDDIYCIQGSILSEDTGYGLRIGCVCHMTVALG